VKKFTIITTKDFISKENVFIIIIKIKIIIIMTFINERTH